MDGGRGVVLSSEVEVATGVVGGSGVSFAVSSILGDGEAILDMEAGDTLIRRWLIRR